MPKPENWLRHSPMSEPASHAGAIGELPSGVGYLAAIVQGLLVHEAWLSAYRLDERDYRDVSRATLPVAERLNRVLGQNPRRLQIVRPPRERQVGTCRDFALMLCAFLRCRQIPARVRCGFAAYFGEGWEDHWVCEYWDAPSGQWRLCDPQLDEVLRERCRIDFDPTDVPRQAFLTAGQAWLDCRADHAVARDFGHGDITGAWFVKINVVRDHYAVNHRETSLWDGWRAASPARRTVVEQEKALLDDLAANPEQRLIDIVPDWEQPR